MVARLNEKEVCFSMLKVASRYIAGGGGGGRPPAPGGPARRNNVVDDSNEIVPVPADANNDSRMLLMKKN